MILRRGCEGLLWMRTCNFVDSVVGIIKLRFVEAFLGFWTVLIISMGSCGRCQALSAVGMSLRSRF